VLPNLYGNVVTSEQKCASSAILYYMGTGTSTAGQAMAGWIDWFDITYEACQAHPPHEAQHTVLILSNELHTMNLQFLPHVVTS